MLRFSFLKKKKKHAKNIWLSEKINCLKFNIEEKITPQKFHDIQVAYLHLRKSVSGVIDHFWLLYTETVAASCYFSSSAVR